MKLNLQLVSAFACLSMMTTGARLSNAQPVQQVEPEWLTQMYQEGWRKARAGVLEREAGGGKLETLIGHYDGSTYATDGGTRFGVFIEAHPGGWITARTFVGPLDLGSNHDAPDPLVENSTVDDSFRWVWTESSAGSSTGTGQWGSSKPDLMRPVGHAATRMRLHANETGNIAPVGFDFLEASVTLDPRRSQASCQ